MKISNESVHQIYELSKKVYSTEITAKEAVEEMNKTRAMAEGSTRIYLGIYKCLMKGVGHSRAMNTYSTEYFLRSIYSDLGKEAFIKALKATVAHVDYYNSLGKGRRNTISSIIETLQSEYNLTSELYSIYPDEVDNKKYKEGKAKQVYVNIYERNPAARQECIAIHGLNCAVCDFNFETSYGEIGMGFIYIHHVIDISITGKEYEIDPKNDLVPRLSK